jgi:glutathione S-transferase
MLKPDSGLMPVELLARADVTRWQFWESANWDPACSTIGFERVVKQFLGLGAPDATEVARGEQLFARSASVLDASLKGRRFITGDHLTVADFSLGAWLNVVDVAHYPIAPYNEIRRWYATPIELPRWRETIVIPPLGRVAT